MLASAVVVIMAEQDPTRTIAAEQLVFSVPLLLACLAGLYSERAGVFDTGLEGKMLAGTFAGASAAAVTGSARLGLGAAVATAVFFALVHGFASINHRCDQIVFGVAISFIAAALHHHSRPGLVPAGRAPALSERLAIRSLCPAPKRCAACRCSGLVYPTIRCWSMSRP